MYDEHYYRNACAGFEEWTSSEGAKVAGLYAGSLRRAQLRPGEVVLDIGTGRGELLAVAVELGAGRAIGVEYSAKGVDMARQTLRVHGVEDKAEVHLADARSLPLEDATVDLVTMLDVVEHLAPAELDRTLREARRVLRPGGRVVAHTLPNRYIYDVTYRLQRATRPSRRRRWPADPRVEYERVMHVNEQTAGSLRDALRNAGFGPVRVEHGSWIHVDHVPDARPRRTYARLARVPVLRRFTIADLWGEGIRS